MRDLPQDPQKQRVAVGKASAGQAHRGVGEFALSKAESSPSSPFKVDPTSSICMGTGVGQMLRLDEDGNITPPAQIPRVCPRCVPVTRISVLGVPRRSSGFEFGKLGSKSHLSSFLCKPSPSLP